MAEEGHRYCKNLELIKINERIAIIGAGELGWQIAHLAAKNDYQLSTMLIYVPGWSLEEERLLWTASFIQACTSVFLQNYLKRNTG